MVIDVVGDALKTDCDILCHQVNLQGFMGGGIAAQIAYTYPNVESEYEAYVPKELGEVCFSNARQFVVANCFSQDMDFVTNYDALKRCMEKVRRYMRSNNYTSVAFPYHYGCGIASGDWDTVISIITTELKDVVIKIYHLDK